MITKISRIGLSALRRGTPLQQMSDKWKERGETAQNLYISQKEKDLLKKLLNRVERDQTAPPAEKEDDVFAEKLKTLLQRHKINNEEFEQQVIELHDKYKS